VAAKLKAVQKAASVTAAPPVAVAARSPAQWLAETRSSVTLPVLAAQLGRLRAQAQASGFRTAGVLVTVGIGWIIGANSFDAHAPSRQVVETMTAFANRLDEVETIAKRAQAQDVAGLRASITAMQANLETSRSQTNTAIIEFSAKVDALDRDSAARMVYAARDTSARFEKLDRDVAARLADVDKFVARTNERMQKLEQRPDPEVVSQAPTSSPRAPIALAPIPLPPQRPLADTDFVSLPSETTRVAGELPRSPNANRIPPYGYVLRDVREGVAVLEGRSGLRAFGLGESIPGAGRVRAIERRGGEWVVVTSVGVIDGKGY
jgi:hypothetical protein